MCKQATCSPDEGLNEWTYTRRLLTTYQRTPTTTGRVRPADRKLASNWYRRGLPLRLVEDAFVLTAVRRLFRPWEAPNLPLIRSMHYFQPVIDEIREEQIDPGYLWCQRWKLANLDNYNLRLVDNKRLEPIHTHDEDCDPGEDGVCPQCCVYHGEQCPWCGARGFHRPGCREGQAFGPKTVRLRY